MNPPLPSPAARRLRQAGLAVLAAFLTWGLANCGGGGSSSASQSASAPGAAAPGSASTPPPPPTSAPPVAHNFFFGTQTHFGQGWSPTVVPRLVAGAVRHVRDELYWQVVEPNPGDFRFPPDYDAYMAALRLSDVSPLVELTFENSNYDGGQTPYTDAGFAGYARYATTVLQHYGAQIEAVEVWNEYNGTFNKGPATADRAGTYGKMLRATATAIRAARPDVTIVGGATAGVPLPYFEKLFAAGALDYLDVVSIHPYRTYDPPEGIEQQVTALHNLITKYDPTGRPIWVTEVGWGTRAAAAPGDLAIDEAMQARFLVRACLLLVSAGVERVYWYLFRDDGSTPTMGLVKDDAALTAKLAFNAFRVLNTQLADVGFVAREATDAGVYSLRFASSSGKEVRVLWSLTPIHVPVPAGTTVVDLYGAPVSATSGSVAVADAPVYVTGPLPGLTGAGLTRTVMPLADAAAGFSDQQGDFGWHYGVFTGSSLAFQPLPGVRVTDWKEEWADPADPVVSITAVDQHPGKTGALPAAAVRRWVSDYAGPVHVTGRFRVGTQGDGVRARVLVDGQVVYTAALGTGSSIVGSFDFQRTVQAGSTFDFAVDPGPANNVDFDATLVTVTIEKAVP